MEFISKFLVDYHITTLLFIFTIIFSYYLNKKIKMNELEISILKKDLNIQYEMISDLLDKNDGFVDSKITTISNTKDKISDLTKLFNKIYYSVFDDIKAGKIKSVGETQLCIEKNRIGFGGDRRSEKKENLNLLFDHFVKTNETNVSSFDRDEWHLLINKLTNGQTKTIDYIYYRDFIQELLNRYYKK
jgi:hypothetical protein